MPEHPLGSPVTIMTATTPTNRFQRPPIGGHADGPAVAHMPIPINAYGSERADRFLVTGSETPKGIPSWVWALIIAFLGFALFYIIQYWQLPEPA